VRIVAIADIVMSLDNVIAIAASADIAAARVDNRECGRDQGHADYFRPRHQRAIDRGRQCDPDGVAGALSRLVWAGGALLGWVAGDVMVTDRRWPAGSARRPCRSCTHGAGASCDHR